jgi:hypothetical protein
MNRAGLIGAIFLTVAIRVDALQQPYPGAVRRTYPGLRTLPGQVAPNTAVTAPGQLATNTTAAPLTNNAPVIRVAPTALPGATNAAAAGRSNVTPQQLENINRLDIALNAVRLPTRDQASQQQALLETLRTAPIGKTKPAPDILDKFGATLAEVVPTLNLTAQQRRQLAIDINMAVNSGNLSSVEAQRVLADARSLLQGSTVSNRRGVDDLVQQLSSVVSNVQSNSRRDSSTSDVANNRTNPSPETATGAGQSAGPQSGAGSGSSHVPPATTPR